MADTANQTVASNNLCKHISVVHKDARFLSSDDIQGKADLVVFEVSQHPCGSTLRLGKTHRNPTMYSRAGQSCAAQVL
jgi:hypothetical protein